VRVNAIGRRDAIGGIWESACASKERRGKELFRIGLKREVLHRDAVRESAIRPTGARKIVEVDRLGCAEVEKKGRGRRGTGLVFGR